MRVRPVRFFRPLLIGAALAAATPAGAETLAQALARTYRGNPTLSAERARQRSDDENVPRALAGYRPSINLQAQVGPTFERSRPGTGQSLSSPFVLGLTVDQTLYDSGRTAASIRSAESAVFGGRATLRGVEQTVLLQAVSAYMNVLRDEQIVTLQLGQIDALTETLRIARARFDAGDSRRTDTAQAESRLARGQADLAVARSNLAASQAAYRQAIGAPPGKLVFPPPPEKLLPKSLTAAIASARADHPAIRSAIHAIDGAEHDVKVAEADLGPQVTASGSIQRTFGPRLPSDQTPDLALTGRATIPVYDGGAVSAAVRQAKETVGQRRMELQSTRADVVADMRTAWGALEAARAAIPAAETAVSSNEIALTGVQREQLEGQRTILEVLNAQQELLNSRTLLVTARRDLVVAAYGALSTQGVLTARRLALRGPAYRAETHYDQVRDLKAGVQTPDGR